MEQNNNQGNDPQHDRSINFGDIKGWLQTGFLLFPALFACSYIWFHVHDETIHLSPDEKVHVIDHIEDTNVHLSLEDRITLRELLKEMKLLRKDVQELKGETE